MSDEPNLAVQAFLFRTLASNATVKRLVGENAIRPRPEDSNDRDDLADFGGAFSPRVRLEAERMGNVYELLFCLENSVRELIEATLIEAYSAADWWSQGVSPEIRKKAEKRAAEEAAARWHGPRGNSLLVYTDFLELAEIIRENWQHFEALLGDQGWVTNYFKEMNRSRRALAHTGSLGESDVKWMHFRVQQWISVVG